MWDVLRDNYDYLQISKYEEHLFIIVDGWKVIKDIEAQAKALYPEEIGGFDDVLLHAFEIDATKKYSSCYWGFCDEWYECIHCGSAFCTSPAHACAVPDFWFVENEGYMCGDCIRSDRDFTEEYLRSLNGNHRSANTILTEDCLQQLGFTRFEDDYYCRMFEHCDCPKPIMKKFKEEYPGADLVFNIEACSPFDVEYALWKREAISCE